MNIGTHVVWESQASGSYKVKKGIVITLIPKSIWATPWLKGISKSRIKGNDLNEYSDRVLAAVPRGGKSVLYDYYLPTVKSVRVKPDQFTKEEEKEAFFQLRPKLKLVQTNDEWEVRLAEVDYVIDTFPTKDQALSMCSFHECRVVDVQEKG